MNNSDEFDLLEKISICEDCEQEVKIIDLTECSECGAEVGRCCLFRCVQCRDFICRECTLYHHCEPND